MPKSKTPKLDGRQIKSSTDFFDLAKIIGDTLRDLGLGYKERFFWETKNGVRYVPANNPNYEGVVGTLQAVRAFGLAERLYDLGIEFLLTEAKKAGATQGIAIEYDSACLRVMQESPDSDFAFKPEQIQALYKAVKPYLKR